MNDKERMVLTGIIGAQLGPLLDRWLVPPADQMVVIGWVVVGIPVAYHLAAGFVEKYGPRVMDRWFPPLPTPPAPVFAPTISPIPTINPLPHPPSQAPAAAPK